MRRQGPFVFAMLIALVIAAAMPPVAAAAAESTVEGVLEVIHADDFERGRTSYQYVLRGRGGEATRLLFDDGGPDGLGAHRVRVTGRATRPGEMDVGRSSAVADLGTADGTSEGGTYASAAQAHKRVAVVLMEFKDKGFAEDDLVVASKSESLVFGATSVDSYMTENSFGKLGLAPDEKPGSDGDGVYGPFTLPDQFSSTGPCDYTQWAEAGRAAAGLSDADYDNVIHVLPGNDNCAWGGLAYMPGRYSWVLANSFDATTVRNPDTGVTAAERFRGVTSHEFGHNLGIHHAGSWRCTDGAGAAVPISASCTLREYGDPFSVLGWASLERHVNAYQKARLGWLTSQQIATAAAGTTATPYELRPLEAPGSGLATVRIPRTYTRKGAVSEYYYIEYREPSGFDSDEVPKPAVAGVTIRLAPAPATNAVSKLLDFTSTTVQGYYEGFDDPALAPGTTFADGGITVTVENPTSTGSARVTVTVPPVPTKQGGGRPSRG